MKANTITPGKVADLAAALEAALETVRRVHREIHSGDITPDDAATICNEAAATVKAWAAR